MKVVNSTSEIMADSKILLDSNESYKKLENPAIMSIAKLPPAGDNIRKIGNALMKNLISKSITKNFKE